MGRRCRQAAESSVPNGTWYVGARSSDGVSDIARGDECRDILVAQEASANDWVLGYDAAQELAVPLWGPQPIATLVPGPAAFCVTPDGSRMYMASGVNATEGLVARVHEFAQVASGLSYQGSRAVLAPQPTEPAARFMCGINSMAYDNDRLYVLGFSSPRYPADKRFTTNAIFTTPMLAVLPAGASGPFAAAPLACHDLAFPISVVLGDVPAFPSARGDLTFDGSVDALDVEAFVACAAGPEIKYPDDPPPECESCVPADLDSDQDVDAADSRSCSAAWETAWQRLPPGARSRGGDIRLCSARIPAVSSRG